MNPGILLAVGVAAVLTATVILWPRRGLLSVWQQLRAETERIRIEDALKHFYNNEYMHRVTTIESISGVLTIPRSRTAALLARMEGRKLVSARHGYYQLTKEGSSYAVHIVRAHRLWERYLAEETGLDHTQWHRIAESREHRTSREEADALAALLGNPLYDPHGTPIPTPSGEVGPPKGRPITTATVGERLVVTHIEDEPEEVYAQLVAAKMQPGMQIRLLEIAPERIRICSHDDEHVLAPVAASLISVAPVLMDAPPEEPGTPLSSLHLGEAGRILRFDTTCRGIERRRLMDLGMLPGTTVTAELRGALGDPTSYRIRGALISLREELARNVYIDRSHEPSQEMNHGAAQ